MIKKSVFEDDLIAGMQRELNPIQKNATSDKLLQAVEYLHSAVQIFEDAGMNAKADQVLRILGKIAIAAEAKVRTMPSLKALMEAGVTHKDLKNTQDPASRARVNTAMRVLGYTDREIKHFLGDKFMSEEEAADMLNPEKPYRNLMDWIQNPTTPVDPNNPQTGEAISMKSLMQNAPTSPSKNDLVFNSIAQSKPKDPTKVSDSHKMNPLEMADAAFADDLLDFDLSDAETELLEGNQEDKTFEDSD